MNSSLAATWWCQNKNTNYSWRNSIVSLREDSVSITGVKTSQSPKNQFHKREPFRGGERWRGKFEEGMERRCSEGNQLTVLLQLPSSHFWHGRETTFPPQPMTPESSNASVSSDDVKCSGGEKGSTSHLYWEMGAAPSCRLCLLRPEWQTSYATTSSSCLQHKTRLLICVWKTDLELYFWRLKHPTYYGNLNVWQCQSFGWEDTHFGPDWNIHITTCRKGWYDIFNKFAKVY